MLLREIWSGLSGARVVGDDGVEVKKVTNDSREIGPGDVYVAVRGLRADGHDFVQAAIDKGAAAVVVERELPALTVPQVIVPNSQAVLGVLVGRSLGEPAKGMTLIGITGTNGKTTTTYLVESILVAAGHKVGVIGTVEMRHGTTKIPASYTTPTPQMLHDALAQMKAAGVTHVVMEVTSIAISQQRVAGMTFAVGAFSNLTQDHLDIHGTMEAYAAEKRKLFSELLAADGTAVVNVDDPAGASMGAAAKGRVLRVTSKDAPGAEIRVATAESTVRGIAASVVTPRGEIAINARPLIGAYNVDNLALAVGIAEALGIDAAAIIGGIVALPGVPGRVERVAGDSDLDIFVDYAHTPDALRNVLLALRPLTKRRLICVFGCGGDRDPTKRPKMGAEVTELADLAVVTSDNPRTEDPRAILEQILVAVPRPFVVDVDRRTAIRAAISEATPGDVVLIAGKGHEDYQIIGTTKHHFDDREEASAAVLERWRRTFVALADDANGQLFGALTEPVSVRDSVPGLGSAPSGHCSRVVIDSRIAAPGDLYVAVRGEKLDGHEFCDAAVAAGATAILVDKESGLGGRHAKAPTIVAADTRIALGGIAHAHRQRWSGKLVAITGSAGKTTTKELTRYALGAAGPTHAANGSLNNETGVPLTLLGMRSFHQFAVIEMGMRGAGQIEYLTKMAEPDVAVVVNAGTAHIELLGTTDAIAQAKAEIWIGLREGGTVVLPSDDPRLEAHAKQHQPRARHVTFGDTDPSDVRLVEYAPREAGGQLVLDVFGTRHELMLNLVGRHAALDACAAIAAAHAAGASVAQALKGLLQAVPPAMRGEVVTIAGRKVIVDCYNANPASMAAAMKALAERAAGKAAIAVVGDMLELGDFSKQAHADTGALAKELGIGIIALGEQAATVVEAAGLRAERAEAPDVAATRAFARTMPGDWLLLKGSRGMRLERVLDAMRVLAPRTSGPLNAEVKT